MDEYSICLILKNLEVEQLSVSFVVIKSANYECSHRRIVDTQMEMFPYN